MIGLGLGLTQIAARRKVGGLSDTQRLQQLLFGNGEQGAFYVPQPVVDGEQVLFTDAAGTTPVTANGDPVGLMLDKSRGTELGPELVVNGTFDDGTTAWTARSNTVLSVVDGALKVEAVSDGAFGVDAAIAVSDGAYYSLTASITEKDSPTIYIGIQGDISTKTSPSDINRLSKSNGNQRFSSAVVAGVAGDFFKIDNISVRQLKGNHATAATSIERPIYSTTPPLQVYDGVEDAMAVTLPPIAAATVAIATPTGTDIRYPVDLSSGSYTITESHSGIIIREGELTADEQQQVTAYLNNLAGV